jgi:hypothetical protein
MVESVARQIALLPFVSFPTFLVTIAKQPLFQVQHRGLVSPNASTVSHSCPEWAQKRAKFANYSF